MSKTADNTAKTIESKINTAELAAAHKRFAVTENADKPGTYDIAVEFLRKRDPSPWRRSVVAAAFPAKEAAAAAVALRNYCIEEMRCISKDERIASPNPVVYNHAKPKAKTGKGKAVRATPSVLPVAV